jgi:MraZ protein
VFLGEFQNTIDEKGRLMIPPVFRDELGSGTLYLTRSTSSCLWLFTEDSFKALSRCIDDGSSPKVLFNPTTMNFKRLVINPARPLCLDKNGRLAIPQELRNAARINGKDSCAIVGSNKYIEIWNAQVYFSYLDSLNANMNGLTIDEAATSKWEW